MCHGGVYLVALPYGRGMAGGVEALQGQQVKLGVRVVSDLMDNLAEKQETEPSVVSDNQIQTVW